MSEECNPQDILSRMANRNRVFNDQAHSMKVMFPVEPEWLGVLHAEPIDSSWSYDVAFVSGYEIEIEMALKFRVIEGSIKGAGLNPAYYLRDVPIPDASRLVLNIPRELAFLRVHIERQLSPKWNLANARDFDNSIDGEFKSLGESLSNAAHIYRQIRIKKIQEQAK